LAKSKKNTPYKKAAKKGKKSDSILDRSFPVLGLLSKLAWAGLIGGLLLTALIFIYVSFTKLPNTEELENPNYEYASLIIADDNSSEIGRYFRENREWSDFTELNPHLIDALVATEDIRFYAHSGIDVRSFARAVAHLGRNGGGSTITQQLAKLFFTNYSRSFIRRVYQKLQEWVIAVHFEKRYTKEEIIAMYLNKFNFTNDAVGISSAATTYFGKNQKDLNIEEAAMLIGMLKGPDLYNPVSKPENAKKRREIVLKQMLRADMMSQEEYDSLRALDLDMSAFRRSDHAEGPAPYFRNELTKKVRNILSDPQYKDPSGTAYDLWDDGLKIYTTIDLDMQIHAEAAMREHMKGVQNRYFEVWKNKDPWTYDADDRQKSARRSKINSMIEASSRYKRLRKKYLNKISQTISSDIDNVRLWNGDINRLIKAKSDDNYLDKLVRRDDISKAMKSTYQEILASEHMPLLINQWNKLQRAAKNDFSKKTKMKVFSYDLSGEKTVTMTPIDSIKYHGEHMHLGSISIEPQTGYVKTWVGGVGYKYFQYDHINSNRQVGSTFKPFIYTTALMQGRSPCLKVVDQQYCIDKDDPNFDISDTWCPKNSNNKYSGESLTLFDALKGSLNSVSAYLMKEIGNVEAVRNLAENMGVTKSKIKPYPSMALGTPDLSVWEMTAAYNVFANQGTYIEPTFIKRIEDKDGKVIYRSNPKSHRALTEEYNYIMVQMLKHASSVRAWELETEFGGKTGTTDDHIDGWFMGITPNLVVGTWVGGEESYIRFTELRDGAGSKMARPYFMKFIKRLETDRNIGWDKTRIFQMPQEALTIVTDCSQYEQYYQPDVVPEDEMEEDEFGDEGE